MQATVGKKNSLQIENTLEAGTTLKTRLKKESEVGN